MGFREDIANEWRDVFCNMDEFGETCEINGYTVPCCHEPLTVEKEITEERPDVSYEGITIFVAKKDMPDKLLPGRAITFNGEKWHVLSVEDNIIVREIKLYRERA